MIRQFKSIATKNIVQQKISNYKISSDEIEIIETILKILVQYSILFPHIFYNKQESADITSRTKQETTIRHVFT